MIEMTTEMAAEQLLRSLGLDTTREGLRETPARMARALRELCVPVPFEFTMFDAEGTSEMIVQSDIPFHSLCEHHVLPFMGLATVAYIPKGRIVGLSKLARAVKYCSAGLQNQERITKAIADILEEKLQPVGVGVVIQARHLCMELRGVKAHGTSTTTSCLRGALLDDEKARSEFLRLAGRWR